MTIHDKQTRETWIYRAAHEILGSGEDDFIEGYGPEDVSEVVSIIRKHMYADVPPQSAKVTSQAEPLRYREVCGDECCVEGCAYEREGGSSYCSAHKPEGGAL